MYDRTIPREFDLTAVQGHPRSSILVSMESPYVTFYSSGARILEQVGPAAGPKVVWQGLELLVNYYRPNNYIGVKEGGGKISPVH